MSAKSVFSDNEAANIFKWFRQGIPSRRISEWHERDTNHRISHTTILALMREMMDEEQAFKALRDPPEPPPEPVAPAGSDLAHFAEALAAMRRLRHNAHSRRSAGTEQTRAEYSILNTELRMLWFKLLFEAAQKKEVAKEEAAAAVTPPGEAHAGTLTETEKDVQGEEAVVTKPAENEVDFNLSSDLSNTFTGPLQSGSDDGGVPASGGCLHESASPHSRLHADGAAEPAAVPGKSKGKNEVTDAQAAHRAPRPRAAETRSS